MRDCEKLELRSGQLGWRALPRLKEGKFGFNPCLFSDFVYMCGNGSQLIEAFSPQSERFLSHSLELPCNSYCCTLYVHIDVLVVHSYSYVLRLSLGKAGQLVPLTNTPATVLLNKYLNTQPVLDLANRLFFIFQYTECICLEMDTGALVQNFT